MNSFIKLCRPAHIVKNILILFPPFFAQRILEKEVLFSSFFAFCSFSLIASVVYVFNDLVDKDKDKLHPSKRNRPIASGKVSVKSAWLLIIVLLCCGYGLSFFAKDKIASSILLSIFLFINIAYSLSLKNYPIIDLFVLASGFVLRVYYGGTWFNISISPWLFLCVFCGALWFITGKRRNELLYAGKKGETRPVLKKYTLEYLNSSYYLLCAISIIFYSLWTVLGRKTNCALQMSIPVVIFILFRYNFVIETTDADGDPVFMLLKDKLFLLLSLFFAAISFIGIYFL